MPKVTFNLNDDLNAALDRFVEELPFAGTKTAVVETALREFLARQGAPPDAKKAQPVRKENRRTVA